ncbi:toll-like receptor 4 [Saccostrea echinata]|uniref:toll-like receptor 4 n=1 Tax=Saccostrea echinata TaxID=191078 RepID=UPI002A827A26|nr:toll-like receptor 4 [Saccostrea echinata]
MFAVCTDLNLDKAPDFPNNVVGINFARNNFESIPQNLPKSLMYLDMSHNNIQSLDNSSVVRYRLLRNFSVSWNKLSNIQIGTFQLHSNLQHLDISNNDILTIEVISNISSDLKDSRIKTLNFEKLQCTYGISQIIEVNHVAHLKNTNLQELNLASNRINSLELSVLVSLPKSLRVLNLADNKLSFGLYIMEFAVLKSLEILNISFQYSFHQMGMTVDFFEKCNDTRIQGVDLGSSIPGSKNNDTNRGLSFGGLMSKYVDDSTRVENYTVYLPPNLRKLYFHDNLYKMSVPKIPIGPINKLTHIYVQRNIIYEVIGPFTGIENIRYIDFSGNFCGYISKSFLQHFTGIEFLNLSNNAFGQVFEKDKNGEILLYQTRLLLLDLSYNRIHSFSSVIFQKNSMLEHLNLGYNSLNEFTVQINHMKNLSLLDLSFNQLGSLELSVRDALNAIAKDKEVHVNLLGNPLKCSCENLNFIKWMHHSKKLNFVMLENYSCEFKNFKEYPLNEIENLLQEMEKKCSSYTLIIVVMTSLIIVALTATISRIVFRYRLKLRYLYYVAKEKYQGEIVDDVNIKKSLYRYDAFISYTDQDRLFVINLVRKLENKYDLRLCIHHRDFIPGTGIMDNITNAIHCSKRTVCIMTHKDNMQSSEFGPDIFPYRGSNKRERIEIDAMMQTTKMEDIDSPDKLTDR